MYQVTKMLNSFENNKLQILILIIIENTQKCVCNWTLLHFLAQVPLKLLILQISSTLF